MTLHNSLYRCRIHFAVLLSQLWRRVYFVVYQWKHDIANICQPNFKKMSETHRNDISKKKLRFKFFFFYIRMWRFSMHIRFDGRQCIRLHWALATLHWLNFHHLIYLVWTILRPQTIDWKRNKSEKCLVRSIFNHSEFEWRCHSKSLKVLVHCTMYSDCTRVHWLYAILRPWFWFVTYLLCFSPTFSTVFRWLCTENP